MKKVSKLVSLAVAAVMAFGIVIAPATAEAKDSPTIGKTDVGVYRIVDVNKKTLRMTGLTPEAKSKKALVISSKTKLDETYYEKFRKDDYTVIRICKDAFKGAKARKIAIPSTVQKIDKYAFRGQKAKRLVIKIRSEKLTKKSVKRMLKGAKAKKITLQLPKSKKAAYKKAFTKKNLGFKGTLKIKWV